MKKIIKWIWQFPQNLIGLIILALNNKEEKEIRHVCGIKVCFVKKGVFDCGVSLGDYIILYDLYKYFPHDYLTNTVKHENGHCKQSKYFGWLYLLLVGLPSVCNNIRNRLFHRKWTNEEKEKWYYSQYPEKWADKLGDVTRD